MPNLDGCETLRRLRDDDVTAGIPFVFSPAQRTALRCGGGMELGADDYLPKPFSPKELLAAVNTRLEKQAELRPFPIANWTNCAATLLWRCRMN
jgi:DNA-binding response OmpR family regulator